MILCQLLIKTNIALSVVMGKHRPHSTQKNRHPLMPAGKTMIEVGKNGKVLPVLLQGLQGLRHLVVGSNLSLIRKESLLVDSIIIGEAHEPLHRAGGGARCPRGWNHCLKHG